MPPLLTRNLLLRGHNFLVNQIASNMSEASTATRIRTFVFMDLETTGLPFEENNRTRITELSMTAVQAEHLSLGVVPSPPRVQNKLTLCFNPWKMINVQCEKITGLSNDLLEKLPGFTKETVDLINGYLKHLPQSVCLVAHNGDSFDFPILRAEVDRAQGTLMDVLCMDSLKAFRQIELLGNETQEASAVVEEKPKSTVPLEHTERYDEILCALSEDKLNVTDRKRSLEVQRANETTPKKPKKIEHSIGVQADSLRFRRGFKLTEVYERYTKNKAIKAHQADADVFMLMMSAATAGDKFISWANRNAKNFCDIKPMTPGRKLGT